jgi:hypothetical protein
MNALRHLFFGAVAVGFLGLSISAVVYAQEMPCTDEIRTLCADVQPGGGRIMQCLKDNEVKLSKACAQRLHDLQGTMSGPLAACRDDWVAYCYHPRTSTSQQEMIQCLQANLPNVSTGCQKALQGAGGKQRQKSDRMIP